ncbi:MAG: Ig-like domain-containing protein, partial [Treponemataceae bacterium]|nr:Ig-like domain-containing protein [Treponemataceae bacterium]
MRKQATWIAVLCAALLSLHVIGCEQDSASVAVERVTLDMTELTLTRGETARLTAAVMPENADDKTVTWHSPDTSIATVGNDGTVTAANAGKTTIYAQAGGMVATCHVTVNPKPAIAESITLSPETIPLTVGNTIVLTPTITWQGDTADYTIVQWWSSDTSVATINDGMITAVAEGTATITAQVGDKTATCTVTVKPVPVIAVKSVTLSKNTITLMRGTGECLTATVTPDDADDRTVTWWSSDTSVATVDAWGGWVTARGVGTATIYARAGDITAECAVTVNPVFVQIINLYMRDTVTRGETVRATTYVFPEDADDKTILWSSSDETVATVDSDGTVTTHKAGETTITATARAGGMTAERKLTVNPLYVKEITLNQTSLKLKPDMTRTLTATVTPDDADDTTVTWSSSDETVATVDADGTVTAHNYGETSICATATGSNPLAPPKQTCRVTVLSVLINVESVMLDTDMLTLTRGETARLTATVTPKDADNKTVSWSSSDTSVATVDADGTVTAVRAGTTIIYAKTDTTWFHGYATCTVTVNPIRVENIALSMTELTLARGETGKLTATVLPENADNKTVTWQLSDTSVATVDDDGTVTALKQGTAVITAQADGKTATCTVTVPPTRVESITLDKESLTLTRGGWERLSATVTPDSDDIKVTWSSSDTAVATVVEDSFGRLLVTAVAKGTAVITAQAGDKTATCTVTVNPI